jgi:hypothetical protein
MHPGITFPFIRKVTFAATVTLAVITIEVLYVAVVTDPASVSELKVEVSKTFATVIAITCELVAFPAKSVATKLTS